MNWEKMVFVKKHILFVSRYVRSCLEFAMLRKIASRKGRYFFYNLKNLALLTLLVKFAAKKRGKFFYWIQIEITKINSITRRSSL